MATEETYQCPQCATRFALREAKQIGTNPQNPLYECPGCEDTYLRFVTYVDGFVERPFRTPLLRFHNQLYYPKCGLHKVGGPNE